MTHSRLWDIETRRPSVENVTLGLRPHVTVSTLGSSYFHVPLTTVRHLLNGTVLYSINECIFTPVWNNQATKSHDIQSNCSMHHYEWVLYKNISLQTGRFFTRSLASHHMLIFNIADYGFSWHQEFYASEYTKFGVYNRFSIFMSVKWNKLAN